MKYSVPQKKTLGGSPEWETIYSFQEQHIEGKYLNKIVYARGEIRLHTTTVFQDTDAIINGLTEMSIHYSGSEEYYKAFRFHYSFFPSVGCGSQQDYLPPCRRLRLDKVVEYSGDGRNSKPPYWFFYDETPLPPRGSFSKDYWGYYNGADNNHLVPSITLRNYHNPFDIPPGYNQNGSFDIDELVRVNTLILNRNEKSWSYAGADRNPNSEKMLAGSLRRIVYPTGGSTIINYESHDFGYYSFPQQFRWSVHEVENVNQFSTIETSGRLHIPFAQSVKALPLFYIREGGIKDKEVDDPPSDSSSVMISGPISGPDALDTVFQFTYAKSTETKPPTVGEHSIWLIKGDYIVYAKAHDRGDLTRFIVKYHPGRYDTVVRIFSKTYEAVPVQTNSEHYNDGSRYEKEDFILDEMDSPDVSIAYTFTSETHPDQVSSQNPGDLRSLVKVLKTGGDTSVIFRREFSGNEVRWDPVSNRWILDGSTSLILNPGSYSIEFKPRMDSEFGYIRITFNKAVEIQNRAIAGGLRVKEMLQLDNESDTLTLTRYDYTVEDNGEVRSSGVLMPFPVYYDLPDELYYLSSSALNRNFMPLTTYSSGKSISGTTSGSHIGYRKVTVSQPGAGRTEYRFNTALEFPDITSVYFPYPPPVSYDWKRGMLTEQSSFRGNGAIRSTKRMTYNEHDGSGYRKFIPSMKVVQIHPDNPVAWAYAKYYLPAGWIRLEEESTESFDLQGERPVIHHITTDYSPEHLQITAKTFTGSDGSERSTQYTYPRDIDNSSSAESLLINRHMVNKVIQTESFHDGIRIKGDRTKYGIFNGSIVLPEIREKLEAAFYTGYEFYDSYDIWGNLTQFHNMDKVPKSMNWDEEGLNLMAVINNSEYFDNVRSYPEGARITSYTNHPFMGITSETDPNGNSLYYEYDPFGRLQEIRNDDNQILQYTEYNLKKYSGDTARPGFNQPLLIFSEPADAIEAHYDTITRTCELTLSVSGGTLGTEAGWVWYVENCGIKRTGEGPAITVAPAVSTRYYLRAEGSANNTPCVSKTIYVKDPQFVVVPDLIRFSETGTAGEQYQSGIDYSGCDPVDVSVDVAWLQAVLENDFRLVINCDTNDSFEERMGIISLKPGMVDTVITVIQEGSRELLIDLEAVPKFAAEGDTVSLRCSVLSGTPDFTYIWEWKVEPGGVWEFLTQTENSQAFSDSIEVVAPGSDHRVRCRVRSGNQEKEASLVIRITE